MTLELVKRAQAEARWNADLERRIKIQRYLDFYRNRVDGLIAERIDAMMDREEAREMKKYIEHDNVTQRMIEEISLIFHQPPRIKPVRRTATGSREAPPDVQQRFDWLLQDCGFHRTMVEVEKLSKLTFDVGVLPQIRQGRLELDIITGEKAFVHQDPEDPTRAIRFFYQVGVMENTPSAGRIDLYHFWDATGKYACRVDGSGNIADVDKLPHLDFGAKIPVIMFRNYLPVDSFWLDAENPIVDKNMAIDLRRTELAMAEAYSIPQRVNKGVPRDQQIKLGRTFMLNIPLNDLGEAVGDSYYVSPKENLLQRNELILSRIEQTGLAFGLSRSIITGQNATSGYELALSKYEIVERNRRQRVYYRDAIRQLLDVILTAARKGLRMDLPQTLDFMIDFPEIEFARSGEEKMREQDWRLHRRLASRADVLMEDNPDLDREAALLKLREIDRQAETVPVVAQPRENAIS